MPRWSTRVAAGSLAAGCCLIGWFGERSTAAQNPAPRSSVRPTPIVQKATKTKVPIAAVSMASLPTPLALDIDRSMKARRELAWSIVQKVWTLVGRADAQVPAWMTWYEQEDLESLFRQVLADPRPSTPAETASRVSAVMASNTEKDLQTSLSAARLGKVLRQFRFSGFRSLNTHAKPGTGSIFYNPAYVAHLLTNAERIAAYNSAAFHEKTSAIATAPRQTPQLTAPPPANAYALSMESEMPSDALMIKVDWVPVERGAIPYALDGQHLAGGFHESPTGNFDVITFPNSTKPFTYKIATPEYKSGAARLIVVSDETGKRWALMGMHIASKVKRTWLWITFMWVATGLHDWDADKPAFFQDAHDPEPWYGWPLHQYGIAVASDFTEGDPAPWAAFDRVPETGGIGPNADLHDMSTSLKDLAAAMKGLQWSANPYIEAGMSHTNCIGCHQGSPNEFLATTLTRVRSTNVGDFSFSIATNRETFLRILRERR